MNGRLPQTFIQDVLARTDLIDLVSGRVHLKKRGNNYLGLCPFHNEKTASFTVSSDKQFYYCFGCGAHGNAIDFLKSFDRMDFLEALTLLAERAGLEIPHNTQDKQKSVETELHYQLLEKVNYHYQQQLRDFKPAIDYLKSRGLKGVVAKQFGIGYSPNSFNYLTTVFKDENSRRLLIENGLLIKKDNRSFDRFRHRIMFPIRNRRGKVVGFGGRTLNDEQPKYLNSPETPLFQKGHELYGLYETLKDRTHPKTLLIVEGYMDVISLHQNGIHYAVATLGTAVSARHIQTLLRHTQTITFCFDGDAAGRNAAWRALLHSLPFMRDGIHIYFLFLPEGEDPDSFIAKIGQRAFEERIQNAQPLSEFFFKHLSEEIPIRSLDDKAHFANEAMRHLNTLPKGLFYELLIEQLSKYLGIPSEGLMRPIESPSVFKRPSRRPSSTSQMLTPAYWAMALLLHAPKLAMQITDISTFKQSNEEGLNMFIKLLHHFQQNPQLTTHELLTQWPSEEERRLIASLALRSLAFTDPDAIKSEFEGAITRLEQRQATEQAEAFIKAAKVRELSLKEKKTLQNLLMKRPDDLI